MSGRDARMDAEVSATAGFAKGLARAFGGAVFFSLPLLMTMEMWWLGFYMDRLRLALFIAVFLPLLVGLDHYSGFRETSRWRDDVLDAAVAYAVGYAASFVVLVLFGVITFAEPAREILGMVALQSVPAGFGAVLASSQLGVSGGPEEERKERGGYAAEVFFMLAGAIFLAFNVAPTEEMILIAYKMTDWHGVALAVTSLAMMHAFVYAVDFRGTEVEPEGTPQWSIFVRFTMVGYAVSLLVSAYILWTFGRFDGADVAQIVMETVVLAFPASLGASAARLLL